MGKRENLVQRYLEEGLVALLPASGVKEGGTRVLTLKEQYQDKRSLSWLVELLARFYSLDAAAVRRHSGGLLGLRHHIPLPLAEGLVLLPVKVGGAAPAAAGEGTTGYVNLLQVKGVTPFNLEDAAAAGMAAAAKGFAAAGSGNTGTDTGKNVVADAAAFYNPAPAAAGKAVPAAAIPHLQYGNPVSSRSLINCGGGQVIFCSNTVATVHEKIRQGETVHRELLQRHKLAAVPAATTFKGLDGAALRQMLPSCSCLLRSFFLWMLDSAMPQQRER